MAAKLPTVSPEEEKRIRGEIEKLRRRDPEAVKRFESLPKDPAFEAFLSAIEDSERITAKDLAVYINTRDTDKF